ncbi:MAG: glycerophosphodiester phosphodiesterase [Pyrinomonadaceae bacterium]
MSNQPLIIGHRGSSAVAPENTLAAFKRAIREGADGIEFDVRLARDRVPVVIHDAALTRTASVNKLVSELTSDELQQIDVGAWFHRSSQVPRTAEAETVPTLSQVFELFSDEVGSLYLEMKGEPVGKLLPAEVTRLIRKYSFHERVIVESFDHAAIAEVKRVAPEIRTAALFERKITRPLLSGRNILGRAHETRADEIALHHTLVRDTLVRQARNAGFAVVVWTVEEQHWIERAQKLGIKALISNNPAIMLQYRTAATAV